ncbi:hypothetical protein HY640_03295 [Candidatus Woesearchaeota archaeon]|nr:hypothetical protein [Candidatus Woesearchaeota archaeon]
MSKGRKRFSFSTEDRAVIDRISEDMRNADVYERAVIGAIAGIVQRKRVEVERFTVLYSDLESLEGAVRSAFSEMFRAQGRNYGSLVPRMRSGMERYSRTLDFLALDPVFREILPRDFTVVGLRDVLIAVGLRVPEVATEYDHHAVYLLFQRVVGLPNKFEALETRPYQYLSAFLDALGEIVKNCPVAVPRFLRDTELRYVEESREAVKLKSLTAGSINPRLMANPVHGDARDVLRAMALLCPGYQEASASGLLRFARPDGYQAVIRMSEVVRALRSAGSDPRQAGELASAANDSSREELLWLLSERPEYLVLWQRLRKARVQPAKYIDFILNYAHLSRDAGSERGYETIGRMLDKGMSGSARLLVESGYAWPVDTEFPAFLECASGTESPEAFIGGYLRYAREGAEGKARVMRSLARQQVSAIRLKETRQKMSYASDDELAALPEPVTLRDIDRVLLRPRQEERHPKIMTDTLELLCARQSGEDSAWVRSAYLALQSRHLESVIRNIWRTQPGQIAAFAREVVSYSGDEQLYAALSNASLFHAVRGALAGGRPFGSILAGLSLESGNFYRDALDALTSKKGIGHATVQGSLLKGPDECRPCGKIIIFCESYSAEAEARIRNELSPAEVLVYGMSGRVRLPSSVDAVFWVTPRSPHSAYYAAKSACKNAEIPFYHINFLSREAVISEARRHFRVNGV